MRIGSSSRVAVALALVLAVIAGAASRADAGQQPQQPASDGSLKRWVELDAFTLYSRYHFVENNADKVTSDNTQYKSVLRAHVNVDRKKRLTINAGAFTGSTFISTWNTLGIGPGDFDPHHHYLKQLYVAAVPVRGWEAQYGSLYVRRGDEDEITSYDDDGYLVGERLTVKPPRALWVDEVVVTRGEIGPYTEPNAFSRWRDPSHANYGQAIVSKRFNQRVSGSLEYMTQSGADTLHAGVTLRLPESSPLNTVRYEQYRRVTNHAAAGFALWGDRTFLKTVRVQGGYATVDRYFGGWNADRMQSGRRVFGVLQVPLVSGLALQVFGTEALHADYPIPIKRRVDVTISYDVLSALHHTGWF